MNLSALLETIKFNGIGYLPLVDFESWRVAMLRYHPELLPENIADMQRHDQTDEVFVLMEGRCILFMGEGKQEISSITAVDMLPFQVYNVKKGSWHTHTLSEDARVLIVENQNTCDDNSPKQNLTEEQCLLIREETRKLWRD